MTSSFAKAQAALLNVSTDPKPVYGSMDPSTCIVPACVAAHVATLHAFVTKNHSSLSQRERVCRSNKVYPVTTMVVTTSSMDHGKLSKKVIMR